MQIEIKSDTIKSAITDFANLRDVNFHHRNYSYDFCNSYFRKNRGNLCGENMEKSCYVLWSYLASWGMLRGSSYMLQKNPKFLSKLIEVLNNECDALFDIDVDNYSQKNKNGEDNIDVILKCYDKIEKALKAKRTKIKNPKDTHHKPSVTLVTKIMLGVFGCIPAYDTNFIATFKELSKEENFDASKFGEKSLLYIFNFYDLKRALIDNMRKNLDVVDFGGNKAGYKYSIAKIIDMYGFQYSLNE